jgi:hypothetical protein
VFVRLAIPVASPRGDVTFPGAVCINLDTGEPISVGKSFYPTPPGKPQILPRQGGGYWIVYQGELAELVTAVAICDADGGCHAFKVLERLREQGRR